MRFLPREEKFYELFLDQAKLISQAATLLADSVHKPNADLRAVAEEISSLERKADEIIHEIFTRLNQTFITPIDPEDIHSLSSHLDDVIDGIEELSHRLVTYRISPVPAVVVKGCQEIVACVHALHKAFDALHSNQKVLEHCIEVNRIEEVVDVLIRNAMADLFDTETDPIRLIKLKEIYELVEQTTDYCEDVAVALQNVVVKNS
jgi:predicted phosphate transport protein (TIGR00153 family)